MDDHPLDDPVRASLGGAHAHLARHHGRAVGYAPDVAPFSVHPHHPAGWADLARLVGPAGVTVFATPEPTTPPGWSALREMPGVQMTGDAVVARDDPDALVLGPADVPEMLDLVARTEPGPFAARTIAMGRYLGVRDGGTLVAMAGERLHPPGWTEISAVCTDHAHRGRGLATRLLLAVAAGVRARGETPFLHATADNTGAIRLYEHLGFRLRARPTFHVLRAPADALPDHDIPDAVPDHDSPDDAVPDGSPDDAVPDGSPDDAVPDGSPDDAVGHSAPVPHPTGATRR